MQGDHIGRKRCLYVVFDTDIIIEPALRYRYETSLPFNINIASFAKAPAGHPASIIFFSSPCNKIITGKNDIIDFCAFLNSYTCRSGDTAKRIIRIYRLIPNPPGDRSCSSSFPFTADTCNLLMCDISIVSSASPSPSRKSHDSMLIYSPHTL